MSLLKDAQSESNLHLLNSQEKADPYLVIEELFDFAHLPDIREILWAWLKATVTGSYPKKLTHSERAEILELYEKLEKLIEAVHLMHRNKKMKNKKRSRRIRVS